MKKGLIIIISLLAIMFVPSRVNAASSTVVNFQDGDQICNAFKTGGRFYVYVYNYYAKKNYLMKQII